MEHKADVKTVIHIQLPENLENYYQEAGRPEETVKKAFAANQPSDIIQVENQFIKVLPDKKFLNEMFIRLCIFFKLHMEKVLTKSFLQFESLLYEI
jgi:ATP-dependent DNA helicase RecQ